MCRNSRFQLSFIRAQCGACWRKSQALFVEAIFETASRCGAVSATRPPLFESIRKSSLSRPECCDRLHAQHAPMFLLYFFDYMLRVMNLSISRSLRTLQSRAHRREIESHRGGSVRSVSEVSCARSLSRSRKSRLAIQSFHEEHCFTE